MTWKESDFSTKRGDFKISCNTSNTYFENEAEIKYLGMTIINQNFIHEEIKSRLNLNNASYYNLNLNNASYCHSIQGHALAQAVRSWLPTAAAWFLLSTSVSPVNHFTNFMIIITWGWHSRPMGGCSAKWTQLDFTAHYTNLKKYSIQNLVSFPCAA
jgi:hypothetical protein